jgi:hypothetical protein
MIARCGMRGKGIGLADRPVLPTGASLSRARRGRPKEGSASIIRRPIGNQRTFRWNSTLALDRPPAPQAAPGTRRDSLGAFLVAGAIWVADSPKTSQRLLKRLLSHFAYGESPAAGTRICCAEAAEERRLGSHLRGGGGSQ